MSALKKKLEAVSLIHQGMSYRQASRHCGVSFTTIWRWHKQLEGSLEEMYTFIGATNKKEYLLGLSNEQLNNLPDDPEELKRIIFDLTFENDFKEEVLKIVKKDLGVDLKRLPNWQKAQMVDALKEKRPFSIGQMTSYIELAQATFYYHKNKTTKDKDEQLRDRIKAACKEHPGWGYRRIKKVLDAEDGHNPVSEKRIQRIMKEEGLQIDRRRKNSRYSSYDSRVDTSDVPNIPLREDGKHDFTAQHPNELWVTDVTEFALPNRDRVYLSPVLDCFDSSLPGWEISKSEKAQDLTDPSLIKACKTLKESEHPVAHSDRGGQYHAESWIKICDRYGLQRSMSRKGHSPDNARMEGFFGRMKMEFYDTRNWKGVSTDDFIKALNAWLIYYNEKRPKQSLGWQSPMQYRRNYCKSA